jgi:hypothetical protein
MKQIFTGFHIMGASALLAVVVGCANPPQTEPLLSLSGFRTVAVTTVEQQQFRPYNLMVAEWKGTSVYVYADPVRHQIYVGDQSQYQKYLQLKKELEDYKPPVYD